MADEMVPAAANEAVDPLAETTIMPKPMRVKLMVSHPGSTRPKIKMVKVNGCTFYKKGDSWAHADNACRKADHWDWKIRLVIGGCSLSRVGGEWKHEAMCETGKAYLALQAKVAADIKVDWQADQTKMEEAQKKAFEESRKQMATDAQKFAAMTKPRCLETDGESSNEPVFIAGWSFEKRGDLLRLRDTVNIPKGMKTLYEKVEHVEIHLTRQIGGSVKEFTESALAAISRVQIPATLHQNLTVEV